MNTYRFELFRVAVGPDSQESQERLEIFKAVHHWRTSQTPAISGVEATACHVRFGIGILDIMCLVDDDSMPLAGRAQGTSRTFEVSNQVLVLTFHCHLFSP